MADAGVGEAMLIGAAVGAGTGAATGAATGGGDKVWKNALIGAALGGAGGGIGAGAFGAAGGAGEGAIAPELMTVEAPNAAAGLESLDSGIVNSSLMTQGVEAPAGAFGTSFDTASSLTPADNAALQNIVDTTGGPLQPSPYMSTADARTMTDVPTQGLTPKAAPEAPADASQRTLKDVFGDMRSGQSGWRTDLAEGQTPFKQPPQDTGMSQFMKDYGKPVALGATTVGLGALLKRDSSRYGTPGQQSYTGPLSNIKYDPARYTPTYATPNVYTARYADGGIASLNGQSPAPNMMASGRDETNFMGDGAYPMSQQTVPHFNTPYQMPTSAQQAMASYEPQTNPLTGEATANMAAGGISTIRAIQPGGKWGEMSGDVYGMGQKNKPDWLQQAEPGGFVGATVPGKIDYERQQQAKQDEQNRIQQEAAQAAIDAKDREKYLAMYYGMQGNPSPEIQQGMQTQMARGGIASLGTYSDGGQLLRGPGDGMSDSIPASIGRKQPARLADGEFVVPADVVSHLGNGSTDAGAKQLYSMMDKVRKARTGNRKQGRQINPNKYMPA